MMMQLKRVKMNGAIKRWIITVLYVGIAVAMLGV